MSSGGRQKARMRTEPSIASSSRVTDVPRERARGLELPQARADPRYRLEIGVLVGRSDDGVFLAGHFDEEPPQSPRVRSEVKAHPVFGLVEQDFVHRLPRRDGRGDETGEGVQEEVFAVCPSGVHRRFAHSRQLCNLREVEAVPADVSVEPQARFEDAPVGARLPRAPALPLCSADAGHKTPLAMRLRVREFRAGPHKSLSSYPFSVSPEDGGRRRSKAVRSGAATARSSAGRTDPGILSRATKRSGHAFTFSVPLVPEFAGSSV